MPIIINNAHGPAMSISKGAETKNPLPITEARGVTVARHVFEFRSVL